MANLSITAANVRPGATSDGAKTSRVTAGEAVTAGAVVYKKQTDAEWYLADADASEEEAGQYGIAIAITNAGDGEPLIIQTEGKYTVGAAVVVGEVYVLSDDASGLIRLVSDAGSGDYTTILGVASSTTEIVLKTNVSGSVRA